MSESEENMIRAVVLHPGEDPKVRQIPNTLEALQGVVGGWIEGYTIAPNVKLYANEEGKKLKLLPNMLFGDDVLRGPLVVARHNAAGASVDLTDADLGRFMEALRLRDPEALH